VSFSTALLTNIDEYPPHPPNHIRHGQILPEFKQYTQIKSKSYPMPQSMQRAIPNNICRKGSRGDPPFTSLHVSEQTGVRAMSTRSIGVTETESTT